MKQLVRALGVVFFFSAQSAVSATFTVTDTLDSGVGTLRWAIQQANLSAGPHRIVFAIPGNGVRTIHLTSDLDSVFFKTAIDGTTQPGYNINSGVPLIEIDGSATQSQNGLWVVGDSQGSHVRGLTLNRFPGNALTISADACTLSACYVGLNASGSEASANGLGVAVGAHHVLIGGHLPASRNVISGNSIGIGIYNSVADSVLGNYIGTDPTGTAAIGNGTAIYVMALETVIGGPGAHDGNLISGNGDGIQSLSGGSPPQSGQGLQVYRNLIGTDESGAHALANQGNGMYVNSPYSVIGGVGKGNVISGNLNQGIWVSSGDHTQIYGNKIGVTADGTAKLGNGYDGIRLDSAFNIVGFSLADGTGNEIGGNGLDGIELVGTDNTIQGNAIGTSFNGALSLGNADFGIDASYDRTLVGGIGPQANIIAHNSLGVEVSSGHGTTIRGNSIFSNEPGLGIDMDTGSPNPVTPNDSLDLDDGPDSLQNFPVITSLSQVGSQIRLQGRCSSSPNATFTLDFYANRTCNSLGYGEGEFWMGSTNVITNTLGAALFDVSYPLSGLPGFVFTATATDTLGNTSEFSPCAPFAEPTAVTAPLNAFVLGAPRPEPARARAEIPFTLARPSHVSLRVYDAAGRRVGTLVEGDLAAGPHAASWATESVRPGVYFCRFQAEATDGSRLTFSSSRPIVVVR